MRKRDNPVFVFGVLTAAVFLIIALWIFFPGCNKAFGSVPVTLQSKKVVDDLSNFLVISDVHLHKELTQDKIEAKSRDAGADVWETAKKKIEEVLNGKAGFDRPKFIILLGDLPWHTKTDMASAHDNIGIVLADVRNLADKAGVALIYVDGNNDPWDSDYGAFSTRIFEEDKTCKTCWPLINPAPLLQVGRGELIDKSEITLGCYSAYPLGKKSKLRVIALNSTIFNKEYSGNQALDAQKQMEWFEGQLAQTPTDESIIIAMHIPPGIDGFKTVKKSRKENKPVEVDLWSEKALYNDVPVQNAFLNLVSKYRKQIVGVLSSHTHMDGIRKLYDSTGLFTTLDISVPAIAPGANYPAIKLVNYIVGSPYTITGFTTLFDSVYQTSTKSWGRAVYSFPGADLTQNQSLFNYVAGLDSITLQKEVEKIYRTGQPADAEEIAVAINVRYRKK